jgi:formamidase
MVTGHGPAHGNEIIMKTLIALDPRKPPEAQGGLVHNRWHPAIPMVATVQPGDAFLVHCLEWTGGQIANDDDAGDIRDADLTRCHYLSGPIGVKGAEPGDLLVVDILDVGPWPEAPWGFTGIFDRKNGGGLLTDFFPEARKACWDFHGVYATSRHIPGVRFAGMVHPGLMGCLPSAALLAEWNRREAALVDTDPDRVPPLAHLPYSKTALLGRLPPQQAKEAAREAARTIPPREHGGNCDIKNLTRGSRVYFPVYVPEAGLSVGDLHFSQGDGEITFCGAIEMGGWIALRVDLIKNGMGLYGLAQPMFQTSPVEPRYGDHLVFEGISVNEQGEQLYLDAHVAYRRACLQAIAYLKHFGYSGAQAYTILGAAPVEGRISSLVDVPNACATLWLPKGIFDFDISPTAQGPIVQLMDTDLAACT